MFRNLARKPALSRRRSVPVAQPTHTKDLPPVPELRPIFTKEEDQRYAGGFYFELFYSDGGYRERKAQSDKDATDMLNKRLEWLRQRDGMRPGEEKE